MFLNENLMGSFQNAWRCKSLNWDGVVPALAGEYVIGGLKLGLPTPERRPILK